MRASPRSVSCALSSALSCAILGAMLGAWSACPRSSSSAAAPAPPPPFSPGKERVRLLFLGDLSVARSVAESTDKAGKGDVAFPFSTFRDVLDAPDLVFANLECVLSDSPAEEATVKTFRIRSPLKYAAKLKEVGVDVVSVANNHAMDFGAQGFASTLRELERQGIAYAGAERESANQAPLVLQVGTSKVGILAYNQHGDEYQHPRFNPQSDTYDIKQVLADVKAARPLVDFLVVSVHGGPELSYVQKKWQEDDARRVIDAGGDLWLGHHPHVVEPIEEYNGKLIVYSLGDFVFDKKTEWVRDRTAPRFFLSVELENGKRVAWKVEAGTHDRDYRPRLDPSFPLEPWINPRAQSKSPYRFFEQLTRSTVKRVRGDDVETCKLNNRRPSIPGGYLRWLEPRYVCRDDAKAPWRTVAATGELFDRTFRQGVWAHPHGGGPLTITFDNVPLTQSLTGFAGVPDPGLAMLGDKPAPPAVKLSVAIADEAHPIAWSETIPFGPGAKALTVDTSALAGQTRDVVVTVEGGAGDGENRFVFNFDVAP